MKKSVKKFVYIFILLLSVSVGASENTENNLIKVAPLGSAAEGRIVSYIPADVGWVPKMQILFMFRETDGSLVHCCPGDFELSPVKLWKSLPENQGKKISFDEVSGLNHMRPQVQKEQGAMCIGMEYAVLSSEYNDANVMAAFMLGRKYRIWSHEFGLYTEFEIPEKLWAMKSLQLLWVVNEGIPVSTPAQPPIIKVSIPRALKNDNLSIQYVAPFDEPVYEQWNRKEIDKNGYAELILSERGGSLRVSPADINGVHALYIVESVTNDVISLPDDADYVYQPEKAVSCRFTLSGSKEAYEKVYYISLYPSPKCFIPVIRHAIYAGSEQKKADFLRTHEVRFSVCPGTYRAVIYNHSRQRHGEMMIEVKSDSEKNVFDVNIKDEGEGLTFPREYLEMFSVEKEEQVK
ncbi:MAG: hypothetical protein JXR40_00510 [Pontiellaceae bacterium]|nr:hypothetical protein [Pontiellaceae bacterium]